MIVPATPIAGCWPNPQRAFSRWARRLAWLRHGTWLLGAGVRMALLVLLCQQPISTPCSGWPIPGWHLLFKFLFGLLIINAVQQTAAGHHLYRLRRAGRSIWPAPRLRDHAALFRRQASACAAASWPVMGSGGAACKLALFAGGILLWRLTLEGGATLGNYAFVLGHMALGAFPVHRQSTVAGRWLCLVGDCLGRTAA